MYVYIFNIIHICNMFMIYIYIYIYIYIHICVSTEINEGSENEMVINQLIGSFENNLLKCIQFNITAMCSGQV